MAIGTGQHHSWAGVHGAMVALGMAADAACVLLVDVGPLLLDSITGLAARRGGCASMRNLLGFLFTRSVKSARDQQGGERRYQPCQREFAEAARVGHGLGHQKARVALARTE